MRSCALQPLMEPDTVRMVQLQLSRGESDSRVDTLKCVEHIEVELEDYVACEIDFESWKQDLACYQDPTSSSGDYENPDDIVARAAAAAAHEADCMSESRSPSLEPPLPIATRKRRYGPLANAARRDAEGAQQPPCVGLVADATATAVTIRTPVRAPNSRLGRPSFGATRLARARPSSSRWRRASEDSRRLSARSGAFGRGCAPFGTERPPATSERAPASRYARLVGPCGGSGLGEATGPTPAARSTAGGHSRGHASTVCGVDCSA